MPTKAKASKTFLRLAPADKIILGQAIINGLLAHAGDFPALPVDTATLKMVNDTLSASTSAARSGDHNLIEVRNTDQGKWDFAFGETADYVSTRADGSAVIITEAGFTPTSGARHPATRPADAQLQKLTPGGQGGTIDISMKAQPEAAAFIYIAAGAEATLHMAADGMVTIDFGNGQKAYIKGDVHRNATLGSLDSGAKLQVIAIPVNATGAGTASSVKMVIPQ